MTGWPDRVLLDALSEAKVPLNDLTGWFCGTFCFYNKIFRIGRLLFKGKFAILFLFRDGFSVSHLILSDESVGLPTSNNYREGAGRGQEAKESLFGRICEEMPAGESTYRYWRGGAGSRQSGRGK